MTPHLFHASRIIPLTRLLSIRVKSKATYSLTSKRLHITNCIGLVFVDDGYSRKYSRMPLDAVKHVQIVKTIETHLDENHLCYILWLAMRKQLLRRKTSRNHIRTFERLGQWIRFCIARPHMHMCIDPACLVLGSV